MLMISTKSCIDLSINRQSLNYLGQTLNRFGSSVGYPMNFPHSLVYPSHQYFVNISYIGRVKHTTNISLR